jgi:hypothetical protein
MQVNLTLNKPAASQFNMDDAKGLKIKIDDGKIAVKFTKSDTGAGVFPLFARTRGGLGVTLTGAIVDKLLAIDGVKADTHMTMEQTAYSWLVATPHESKPSKLVPTLRLWNIGEEVQAKADVAPAKKASAPKASRAGAGNKKATTAKVKAKKAPAADAVAA